MASLRSYGAVVLTALLATACGGSGFSGGLSGGDGGEDSSSSGGDAASGDGSSSSDAGGSAKPQDASDASEGGLSTSDASDAQSDGAAPPCPDVHGAYSVTPVEAQGCGSSFGATAPQCIRQGQLSACGITFQSTVSGGGNMAINGDASLQSDGAFSGAALTEGTSARTGCTGTWVAGTSTMTVDCGGTTSSQSCVLSLVRTAATCN